MQQVTLGALKKGHKATVHNALTFQTYVNTHHTFNYAFNENETLPLNAVTKWNYMETRAWKTCSVTSQRSGKRMKHLTEYSLPSRVFGVSLSMNECELTAALCLNQTGPAQISRYSERSTVSRSTCSVEWPNYRDLFMAAWLCRFSVPDTCGDVLFTKKNHCYTNYKYAYTS